MTRIAAILATSLGLLWGCAGAAPPPPRHTAGGSDTGYPGRCALLGVEQTTREAGLASDSVELVARYQPDGV